MLSVTPRHQLVQPGDFVIGDALEDIGQPAAFVSGVVRIVRFLRLRLMLQFPPQLGAILMSTIPSRGPSGKNSSQARPILAARMRRTAWMVSESAAHSTTSTSLIKAPILASCGRSARSTWWTPGKFAVRQQNYGEVGSGTSRTKKIGAGVGRNSRSASEGCAHARRPVTPAPRGASRCRSILPAEPTLPTSALGPH